jgi:ribosomal protein S18 acetylase RimI-like enzyme
MVVWLFFASVVVVSVMCDGWSSHKNEAEVIHASFDSREKSGKDCTLRCKVHDIMACCRLQRRLVTSIPCVAILLRRLCLVLYLLASAAPGIVDAFDVQIRQASAEHVARARQILFKEAMNPLSISQEHLLVAIAAKDSSAVTDFKSSPLLDGSNSNQERERLLAGFGQIRPLDDNFAELASLYVLPEFRRMGIATRIITALLQRHDDGASKGLAVCLLTLRPTVPLYEKHGFRVVNVNNKQQKDVLPRSLQFELAAGSVISAILGNDLVAMMRDID